MWSICLIIGSINLDRLVKVLSARFFQVELLFIIFEYLGEILWDCANILFLLKFPSTNLAFIGGSYLQQLLLQCYCDLIRPHSFYIYLLDLFVRKSCSFHFLFINSMFYLYQDELGDIYFIWGGYNLVLFFSLFWVFSNIIPALQYYYFCFKLLVVC